MQKLSLILVEIFYHIFAPFDPESLLRTKLVLLIFLIKLARKTTFCSKFSNGLG